jgi:hypothetical protein
MAAKEFEASQTNEECQMDQASRQATQAIMRLRHLEKVVIEVASDGFIWRLVGDGGQEVVVASGGGNQIAGMLRCTEVLLNTELGIRETRLICLGLN